MLKSILLLIGYTFLLSFLLFSKAPPTIEEQDGGWTKATRGGGVSLLAYADTYASEEQIKKDIMKMLYFHSSRQMNLVAMWNQDQVNTVAKVLQFGNNHKDYRIDYKLVLGYFGHESKMCIAPWCSTSPNTDGTIDYGLGQHNSCCLRERWVQAYWLAKQYNIIPGRLPTTDKYDVMSQTIATIQHLKENRQWLDWYGHENHISYGIRDWVLVYNLGKSGYLSNRKGEQFNTKYYTLVMDGFRYLNNNDHYATWLTGGYGQTQ